MKDGQKSRSVRSLMVHACASPVHELQELRLRPELWQRVHAARMGPGQRELVVELDPPVTASCVKVSPSSVLVYPGLLDITARCGWSCCVFTKVVPAREFAGIILLWKCR